jgi:Pyridoxamine 5'-phosphate oxidase
MNFSELFQQYGIGVMATADRDGKVNTAVYARPHVIDATTLVWGMTEGRSYRNIAQNPQASYLFRASGPGFQGVRLELELLRTEESGEMLAQIQQNTNEVVGPGAGSNVTHAAWFRVREVRPLI